MICKDFKIFAFEFFPLFSLIFKTSDKSQSANSCVQKMLSLIFLWSPVVIHE